MSALSSRHSARAGQTRSLSCVPHGSPSDCHIERISHAFLATRDGRAPHRRLRAAGLYRAELCPDLRVPAARVFSSGPVIEAGRAAAAAARIRSAADAGAGLLLDAGLLGLEQRRLLLGARRLGRAAAAGPSVDAGLLGVRRRRLCLPSRLLGPHVGFYGGVNYGFGYYGRGYDGGRWERRALLLQYRRQQFRRGSRSPTSTASQFRPRGGQPRRASTAARAEFSPTPTPEAGAPTI